MSRNRVTARDLAALPRVDLELREVEPGTLAGDTLPAVRRLVAAVTLALLPHARRLHRTRVALELPGGASGWPKLRKLVFTVTYDMARPPLLPHQQEPATTSAAFHLALYTTSGELKLLARYNDRREAVWRRGSSPVNDLRCFVDKFAKDASGRRPVLDAEGQPDYEDTKPFCDFTRLLLSLQKLRSPSLHLGLLNEERVAVALRFSPSAPVLGHDHLLHLSSFPDRPDRSRSPVATAAAARRRRSPSSSSESTLFELPEQEDGGEEQQEHQRQGEGQVGEPAAAAAA
jgi:hypothetical protein